MGYSRKDKKPFEPLSLLMSTEKEVNIFLSKDNLKKEKAIIENTKVFLKGFYSDFSLELLSTLDYIIQKEGTTDLIKIKDFLNNWSSRKSQQFGNNRFLELGLKKLETMETVNCELRII
jgi:hypothetical protein